MCFGLNPDASSSHEGKGREGKFLYRGLVYPPPFSFLHFMHLSILYFPPHHLFFLFLIFFNSRLERHLSCHICSPLLRGGSRPVVWLCCVSTLYFFLLYFHRCLYFTFSLDELPLVSEIFFWIANCVNSTLYASLTPSWRFLPSFFFFHFSFSALLPRKSPHSHREPWTLSIF